MNIILLTIKIEHPSLSSEGCFNIFNEMLNYLIIFIFGNIQV